jgi:hypothetical protein
VNRNYLRTQSITAMLKAVRNKEGNKLSNTSFFIKAAQRLGYLDSEKDVPKGWCSLGDGDIIIHKSSVHDFTIEDHEIVDALNKHLKKNESHYQTQKLYRMKIGKLFFYDLIFTEGRSFYSCISPPGTKSPTVTKYSDSSYIVFNNSSNNRIGRINHMFIIEGKIYIIVEDFQNFSPISVFFEVEVKKYPLTVITTDCIYDQLCVMNLSCKKIGLTSRLGYGFKLKE